MSIDKIENYSDFEKSTKPHDLISKLSVVCELWEQVYESTRKEGAQENEAREKEEDLVSEILNYDFDPSVLSERELAVIDWYLSVGSALDLKNKLAKKLNIEYKDFLDENATHGISTVEPALK